MNKLQNPEKKYSKNRLKLRIIVATKPGKKIKKCFSLFALILIFTKRNSTVTKYNIKFQFNSCK